MKDWRFAFYYILGLLPSLFFTLRLLVQWISSEKKRRSYVNTTFWYLSLFGNILCVIHYFIQLQYLLMLIQTANGFISWRNLGLLRQKNNPRSLSHSLFLLIFLLVLSSTLFFCQLFWLDKSFSILQTPLGLSTKDEVSFLWHLFGSLGCLLFASRFWVQWIESEKRGISQLGPHFWKMSMIGSLAALIYFLHIHDWVSSLNYSFGIVPYLRNLILLRKEKINL